MTKNIIVTGGAGYIGSHACKSLYNKGYNPITIDSLCTGWSDAIKFGPFEKVNLLDKFKLNQIFSKYKPSAVMHFAAFSEVSESMKKPGKYWQNNLLGSLNLIQIAIEHKCFDFVFSSTCATYGNHNCLISEKTPQIPITPYGTSKRAIEEIIKQFSISDGLRYVIFRYFNVAGADEDSEIGEFHKPETHLIPLIFDSVIGKREHITIFGTDYNTNDGTCIRDYVHVSDLIDAHILGLNLLRNEEENKIYNLGSGIGFSVREVIECCQQVTNKIVPVIEGNRRNGDCAKLISSSSLVNKELGWDPYRSNLKQMISDSWKWHQSGLYLK